MNTTSDNSGLPVFENGRFLDAGELNHLVAVIKTLQRDVEQLKNQPPPPSPVGEYHFAPTSLTRIPNLPPPECPYRVWSDRQPGPDFMDAADLTVTVRPGDEAVIELDDRRRVLRALRKGEGVVEVRLAGQVVLRETVYVREITNQACALIHLTPDGGGNLRPTRQDLVAQHAHENLRDVVDLRTPEPGEPSPQLLRLVDLHPRPKGALILLLACRRAPAEVTIQYRRGGTTSDRPTVHWVPGSADRWVFHPCFLAWNLPFDELLIGGAPVLAARIPLAPGDAP